MTSTILKATLSELIDTMEAEGQNCNHYVDLAKGLRDVKGRLVWLPRENKAKFGDGPLSYPTLVLVGDDDDTPTGPSGWDEATLISAASRAHTIVLHACAADDTYKMLPVMTMMVGKIMLIECAPRVFGEWAYFVQKHAPQAMPLCVYPYDLPLPDIGEWKAIYNA